MNDAYNSVKNLESCVNLSISEGTISAVEGLMVIRNFPGPFIACMYIAFGMLIYRRFLFKQTFMFALGYLGRYSNMYPKETLKEWRDKYKTTGNF